MRRHVMLYLPRKDGSRLADHYEAVAVHTGDWPETAEIPEVPEAALDVWEWYFDIRSGVKPGINGVDPVSPQDIMGWSALSGIMPDRFQVRMLKVLDSEYVAKVAAMRK